MSDLLSVNLRYSSVLFMFVVFFVFMISISTLSLYSKFFDGNLFKLKILIYTLLFGFRNDIGSDYRVYIDIFSGEKDPNELELFFDLLARVNTFLFDYIDLSGQFGILIVSFLMFFSLYVVIKNNVESGKCLFLDLIVFSCLILFTSTIRQGLSATFLCLAIVYICGSKGKLKSAIVTFVFVFSHKTSLLFSFPLLFKLKVDTYYKYFFIILISMVINQFHVATFVTQTVLSLAGDSLSWRSVYIEENGRFKVDLNVYRLILENIYLSLAVLMSIHFKGKLTIEQYDIIVVLSKIIIFSQVMLLCFSDFGVFISRVLFSSKLISILTIGIMFSYLNNANKILLTIILIVNSSMFYLDELSVHNGDSYFDGSLFGL